IIFLFALPILAHAQTVPGPADPARITPAPEIQPKFRKSSPFETKAAPDLEIPAGLSDTYFHLESVKINGLSAYSENDLDDIWTPYIGKKISLEKLWVIAGQITERYRAQGYFLSRAYVPAQEISDGNVIIEVVEGYVSEVQFSDTPPQHKIIHQLTNRITRSRPLSAQALESFMLQMNDLPGQQFRAVVEPLETDVAGEVRLRVLPIESSPDAFVSFDNNGSRFLGPYQTTATYRDSLIPMQETSITALTSLPADEINYIALRHEIPLFPDWKAFMSSSYVRSSPGASLEPFDIESQSTTLGLGMEWQPIRQWQENLRFQFSVTGRNTNGDILDNDPQTRDRIRTFRATVDYDTADRLDGYNYLNVSLNQGLSILGASEEGAANLSRAQADPDFTYAAMDYTRQQALPYNMLAIGRVAGQLASGPLYSAEEFGVGGQSFGRAYDPSEILGDHGLAAAIELRYQGFNPWQGLCYAPFAFYDIGRVWNEDTGEASDSLSSAGLGVRLQHEVGLSGQIGLAWPLTREVDQPIYGGGDSPRILLQFGYAF
ncbi:MAG: ShlB/FhaC/HecB family hemolysin secretion/activation protein, partial [Pseudomonadota bacterium]